MPSQLGATTEARSIISENMKNDNEKTNVSKITNTLSNIEDDVILIVSKKIYINKIH